VLLSDQPRIPAGQRVYAVGDIHGRADLLEDLLGKIQGDMDQAGPAEPRLVFLGDYVDRGPASQAVIERLREGPIPGVPTVCLIGNHDERLRAILKGEADLVGWLQWGGAATLASYGVDAESLLDRRDPEAAIIEVLRRNVPLAHRAFLESLAAYWPIGDYLFVHAGLRPGMAPEAQDFHDLIWIREPFLTSTADLGPVVVHGHTIHRDVTEADNRIAIDTGAFMSGRLSCLVLEDTQRRVLQTADVPG
jgi:serine/threonine protein phosphatase 1